MALTKLPKNAIADGAIDASKIEDGTVQNLEIQGNLTNEKFAGSIANDRLANSSITINGTSVSLGTTSTITLDTDWQALTVADGSTQVITEVGKGYFLDTNAGVIEVFLPTSPTRGDKVILADYSGTFGTNQLIINTGGVNIDSTVGSEFKVTTNNAIVECVYVDAAKGWLVYLNQAAGTTPSSVMNAQGGYDTPPASFVTATGGTITTSGDYKIHTFTGDGCFVVSCAGFILAGSGSKTVDYLVVAGGGGGGSNSGGGGGAGGFRVSNSYGLPAPTTSPLASSCGLTVTATTYPITVGGGGAAPANSFPSPSTKGGDGSNSIFSTITSTGGGGGSAASQGGASGGSGGGAASVGSPIYNGYAGNTPPTSPPQGNPGGTTTGPQNANNLAGSGGGGAGAAGSNVPAAGQPAGPGGVGSYVSPSFAVGCAGTPGPVGSTRYFAGGGGGGLQTDNSSVPAPGGIEGGAGGGGSGVRVAGAPPAPTPFNGTAGTANTGGGGGAGGRYDNGKGAAGGKGIVIIRYKFQ